MTATAALASHIEHLLAEREADLRTHLRALPVDGERSAEVTDFKDAALADTEAAIQEAAQDLAAAELSEVLAARRRLHDGSYGTCQDCGDPIPEQRLLAVPWARFCMACQAAAEAPASSRPAALDRSHQP